MKDPYLRDEAIIVNIKPETKDTKTYTMSFVDKSLQEKFSFVPGQFILISILGVGEAAFSLSSNPLDTETFATTIRKVGSLTGILDKCQIGDKLRVGGPFGHGWPVNSVKGKDVLLIAGGLGLLPIWPLVHLFRAYRQDYGNLEILYGAHSPEDCLFIDKYQTIRNIKDTYFTLTVDTVPGEKWEHNIGVVTTLFDRMITKPGSSVVLTCGPEIMMRFVVRDLLQKGFTEEEIYVSLERRMRCGFAQCGHCQIGPKFVCTDGPVFRYADIMALPDMNL